MLTSYKKGRDDSGQSGQAYKYRVPSVPSRSPEFSRLGTLSGRLPCHSALDCAVVTTRPMSRTETAVE